MGQTVRFPRAAAYRAKLAVQSGVLVTQLERHGPAEAAGVQRALRRDLIGRETEVAILRSVEQRTLRVVPSAERL